MVGGFGLRTFAYRNCFSLKPGRWLRFAQTKPAHVKKRHPVQQRLPEVYPFFIWMSRATVRRPSVLPQKPHFKNVRVTLCRLIARLETNCSRRQNPVETLDPEERERFRGGPRPPPPPVRQRGESFERRLLESQDLLDSNTWDESKSLDGFVRVCPVRPRTTVVNRLKLFASCDTEKQKQAGIINILLSIFWCMA